MNQPVAQFSSWQDLFDSAHLEELFSEISPWEGGVLPAWDGPVIPFPHTVVSPRPYFFCQAPGILGETLRLLGEWMTFGRPDDTMNTMFTVGVHR